MNQRITGFERNESKLSNLLQSFSNLPENDLLGWKNAIESLFEEMVKQLGEQEKAFQKLRKQFEDHEVLTPKFLGKATKNEN